MKKFQKLFEKRLTSVITVIFSSSQNRYNRHINKCTGFVYCFQAENLETYDSQIKHKNDFPFTVTADLETTTGYNSEIEGGSIFTTSYVMRVNFHPFEKISNHFLRKSWTK